MISQILLFHYEDVIRWPFIYFYFYFWGSIYIQKPRNSIGHLSIAEVGLWDFFLSIHIIWEFTRCGLREKTELLILSICFMLIGNWKVSRLYSDTHAALPPLASAVNWRFPVFLYSERRKTGNCSFTAALVGGKVGFPVFLRSERRKTGNCTYAAGTCLGNHSIRFFNPLFPSFACCWAMGRGVVPQNEGWTCVNHNWVK